MNSFRQQSADLQQSDTNVASASASSTGRWGAIVVAAGSGSRFGTQKQFLELTSSERLVDRAVATADSVADWVVVVLPSGVEWDGVAVYASVEGGSDRLGSVLNGLGRLPQEAEFVLIHDAAHPLATVDLTKRTMLTLSADEAASAAVPMLDAVDVIKRRDDTGALSTVGRESLGSAQVPMAFRRSRLDQAHQRRSEIGRASGPAEDSTLLEELGQRVISVRGEVANIHVVDHESLAVARLLARHHPVGDDHLV